VERLIAWYRVGSSYGALVALVVANLIPLAGVLFLGWSVWQILIIYWLENGIVGFYNVLKMAAVPGLGKLGIIPFFILHYGMFWVVHGVFVWFALPMIWEQMGGATGGPSLVACLWALPVLVLSHGASFVYNWWLGGERYTSSPAREMGAPYGRVVILHVTIVLGAFLVAFLGSPIWALVLLVGLKTVADLAAHLAERRRAGFRARAEGVELYRTPGRTVWS